MSEKIHITVDPELKQFLPRYLDNRKRDLQILREAIEKNDFKTLQSIGHKIRGHALSYGFDRLSSICAMIEKAAGEKKYEIIVSLLNEYRDYIENVDLE